MKNFILIIAAPFILSACAAGSSSTNRVNYQAPVPSSAPISKVSPNSCYSDDLMSLSVYSDYDRSQVTCNTD